MKRIDERDTMFARMAWSKESRAYREYYEMRPERKEADDELRALPNLSEEGTATYHPVNSKISDAVFRYLGDIKPLVEGEVSSVKQEIDPETATRRIKELALKFGADLVGITKLEDKHFYSHRGRMEEKFGEVIDCKHKYAIAFAVQMDKEFLNRAPQLEVTIETVSGYLSAANTGMVVSYFLREIGYDARNHMDGNYLIIAPVVAEDAGLGQIGRMDILITKEYGPCVRLGVVTTDLELIPDEKDDFGLMKFCEICNKCSVTCPGRAISSETIKSTGDIGRWQTDQYKCYRMWRSIGTDCGVCISTCPFTQGVPLDMTNQMKDNVEMMKMILERDKKLFGIRVFEKEPLNIIK